MPEIILMRHGKSDWSAGGADIDRPLNDRGRRSAQAVGRFLTGALRIPDAVLTSPAVRARTTAQLAIEAGGWEVEPQVADALYGGGVSDVIRELTTTAGWERILVTGHEPTWSAAVSALIGGGRVRMATACVACIEVPAVRTLAPGAGQLSWLINPRLLTDGHHDVG